MNGQFVKLMAVSGAVQYIPKDSIVRIDRTKLGGWFVEYIDLSRVSHPRIAITQNCGRSLVRQLTKR